MLTGAFVERSTGLVVQRLPARAPQRGLDAGEMELAPDSPEVAALADAGRGAGGAVLGAYREPLSGQPMLLASLPIKAVAPTPFQRDLFSSFARALPCIDSREVSCGDIVFDEARVCGPHR